MDYGSTLKQARLRLGLSRKDVGDMAGFGKGGAHYIGQIERGECSTPSASRWAAICRVLKIDTTTDEADSIMYTETKEKGVYMIRDEEEGWIAFNLRTDAEKKECGEILDFRDADGTIIKVQVIFGPNGKKTIVPL